MNSAFPVAPLVPLGIDDALLASVPFEIADGDIACVSMCYSVSIFARETKSLFIKSQRTKMILRVK